MLGTGERAPSGGAWRPLKPEDVSVCSTLGQCIRVRYYELVDGGAPAATEDGAVLLVRLGTRVAGWMGRGFYGAVNAFVSFSSLHVPFYIVDEIYLRDTTKGSPEKGQMEEKQSSLHASMVISNREGIGLRTGVQLPLAATMYQNTRKPFVAFETPWPPTLEGITHGQPVLASYSCAVQVPVRGREGGWFWSNREGAGSSSGVRYSRRV